MKYMPVTLPYYACALCLCAALVLTIITCGCTQPQATSAQTSSGVSVTKPDDSHITVAFIGAPGMDKLLELEITHHRQPGKERDAVDRITGLPQHLSRFVQPRPLPDPTAGKITCLSQDTFLTAPERSVRSGYLIFTVFFNAFFVGS